VAGILGSACLTGIGQEEPDSDEYIYMNMARAWAMGKVPYRDFFCAHMPGLLAPATALFSLFGPSTALAKAVPALATILVFLFTYLLARALWKDSPFPAVFALTFLVTSVNIHAVSATYLGLNLSLALALAGVWLHVKNKPALSGLLLAAAPLVRLSLGPLFILFLFLSPDKKRYAAGAAAPLLLGISFLFFFQGFLEQAFWFHIDKTAMDLGARLAVAGSFLWDEKLLLLAAGVGFFLARKDARPLLWALPVLLLFAAVQKVVFPYYFHPALPLLALFAGGGLWLGLRHRLRPELFFVPNLVLFLVLGVVNLAAVVHTYNDDLSLRGALYKLRGTASAPDAHFLDLSGGTFGAYASFLTGIPQTGNRFDWNKQRVITDGAKDSVRAVIELLKEEPSVVVTELEAGSRTIIWSSMKSVRGHLNHHYHLEDYAYHRGRILEIWIPFSGEERPSVELPKAEPRMEIYQVSVVLGTGKIRSYEERARWGLETDKLALFLNRHTDTKLVSNFLFSDAATETIFPEDDLADTRVVTQRFVSLHSKEGQVRLLAENLKDASGFAPVSFVEASFDAQDGTLERCTLFAAFRDRLYPVLRIHRTD